MRLARTLLAAILAIAAVPAMAQRMGSWGHGGFHHGFHGAFGFGFGYPGFYGYGYGYHPYPYPYPVYYAPPPPPPVYPYPAVYYAPRRVHHHYHRVVYRRHCTCF